MESTRARYPPRSHRTPKTFDTARLIIARDFDHGRTITKVPKFLHYQINKINVRIFEPRHLITRNKQGRLKGQMYHNLRKYI